MNTDTGYLLEEVGSLRGRMDISPVSDIQEEFLEDSLMRLERMITDAENCLKLCMTWRRRYKGETDADLKNQVEDEVTKLKTEFKTYKYKMYGFKKP